MYNLQSYLKLSIDDLRNEIKLRKALIQDLKKTRLKKENKALYHLIIEDITYTIEHLQAILESRLRMLKLHSFRQKMKEASKISKQTETD